jgi:hypothetical protein
MIVYLLFTQKDEEHICNFIYSEADGELNSYSLDEDYIVKAVETKYRSAKELDAAFHDKNKSSKAKSKDKKSQLIKKEYPDIKQALYFLGGNLEDFKQGIPAHKKLPQIVNPYDMDFEGEAENLSPVEDIIDDEEFNEDKLLDELKDFQEDEDDKNYEDLNDDDFYK